MQVFRFSYVRSRKIAQSAIFQAVWRGIGISFQSAITAHRLNLICYDNATAQSYFVVYQHFILYLLHSLEECGSF